MKVKQYKNSYNFSIRHKGIFCQNQHCKQ